MHKALLSRSLLTALATLSTLPFSASTLYRKTREDQYYYRRYGNSYPSAHGGAGEDAQPRQIPSPKYIPGSKYPTEGQWVKLDPIDYHYPKPSYDSNSGFRPNDSPYPDSRPKFFQSDHRYSPSGHSGYPSGPSSYPYPSGPSSAYHPPSGPSSAYHPSSGSSYHHRPSVSGSGYPYNSGSWNSHHGISSYGWDKRPADSLCGVCPGTSGSTGGLGGVGVSPQRGEYRGNGYDNLSPEWAIRQMKHHGGGSYSHSPRPQWDSWNKYPPPADYNRGTDDRGNAGSSWSSGSGYGGTSGAGVSSWGDKRPDQDRRPYSPRPYDDRKGIYPVKSTPGTGYWDSHPPREIGWDPEDGRVGVVSGWIGGQKGGSKGGYKGGYDDYDRKDGDVGRVTSGYVFVPNAIEAKPWDATTKGYSKPANWGAGYDRDYASRWDYNAPMSHDRKPQGYDHMPDRFDRRPDGWDARPGGYDTRPGGYNTRPGGYDTRPGGYDSRPGGYDSRPGGYDSRPGGYDSRPGGYDSRPGGYDTRPSGYDTRPGGYDSKPGGYDARPGFDRRPDGYDRGSEGCRTGCGRPGDTLHGHDWRESGTSQDGYPSKRPDHSFPPSGPGNYDSSTRFQNDRLPAPTPTRFNGHSGIGASTEYGYVYRGSYQQDRDQVVSTTISSLPVSTTIVPSTTLPPE
nr:PREDICTED: pro-resilin-like [Bemisia tabaci]